MDVRATLAALLSSPQFEGSLTANTRAAYERLRWLDGQPKPAWADLVAKWPEVEAALAATPPDPAVELVAGIEAARAAGQAAADLDTLKAAFADLCDALAGQQPGQASQIAGRAK